MTTFYQTVEVLSPKQEFNACEDARADGFCLVSRDPMYGYPKKLNFKKLYPRKKPMDVKYVRSLLSRKLQRARNGDCVDLSHEFWEAIGQAVLMLAPIEEAKEQASKSKYKPAGTEHADGHGPVWAPKVRIRDMKTVHPDCGQPFFGLGPDGRWSIYRMTMIVDGQERQRITRRTFEDAMVIYRGYTDTAISKEDWPTHWTEVFSTEVEETEPSWASFLRSRLVDVYAINSPSLKRAVESCIERTIHWEAKKS